MCEPKPPYPDIEIREERKVLLSIMWMPKMRAIMKIRNQENTESGGISFCMGTLGWVPLVWQGFVDASVTLKP